MSRTLFCALVPAAILSGCASLGLADQGTQDGSSRSSAIRVSMAELNADPFPFEGKWVVVEGRLYVPGDCCEALYEPDAEVDEEGYLWSSHHLDLSERGKRQALPKRLDRQWVEATGRVDLACLRAHEDVAASNAYYREQGINRIVMTSGFCHTSGEPSLADARFEVVGKP